MDSIAKRIIDYTMSKMVLPKKKKQKVEEMTSYKEEVLFNSDTLSKIISYLPSVDVLNLAVTCKRFGISDDDNDSLIKESTHMANEDIATEEQLVALPHYDGESSLADYHYLQLLRQPLLFDQLVNGAEYVDEEDKSSVKNSVSQLPAPDTYGSWETAISNNILRAGKHYVSFHFDLGSDEGSLWLGVMRPGQANESASNESASKTPLYPEFYQNFSRTHEERHNDNNIQCCLYNLDSGYCCSSKWDPIYRGGFPNIVRCFLNNQWTSNNVIGMLLDLDEGTLNLYKNGQRLGEMMRGLAGPYCWVASVFNGSSGTIKRGTIPPN